MAQFSATPLSGIAPLTVTFTDLSSNYPTSWSWDFGDGATSTAQNPTHTYSELGTYDVSLTVSNEADSNTQTKPSYINAYGMHADFMAIPVWGSAPLTVTFTVVTPSSVVDLPESYKDALAGVTGTFRASFQPISSRLEAFGKVFQPTTLNGGTTHPRIR